MQKLQIRSMSCVHQSMLEFIAIKYTRNKKEEKEKGDAMIERCLGTLNYRHLDRTLSNYITKLPNSFNRI